MCSNDNNHNSKVGYVGRCSPRVPGIGGVFGTDDYDVAATPARIELCCKRVSFTSVSWNLLTSIFHGNHNKPIYIYILH